MFASVSIAQWPDTFAQLYRLRYELNELDPTYVLIVERGVFGAGTYNAEYTNNYRFKLLRYGQRTDTYVYSVSDSHSPVREAPQIVAEYDTLDEITGVMKLLVGVARDKRQERKP